MRNWIRKHWLAILGFVSFLPTLWTWFKRLLTWAEHIEFIAEHVERFKAMTAWPEIPSLIGLPLLFLGLALIWLDGRLYRRRAKKETSKFSLDPGMAENIPDLRVADIPSLAALLKGASAINCCHCLRVERITAWARPMRVGDPPLTRLSGNIWKDQFSPKSSGRNDRLHPPDIYKNTHKA